MHKRLTPILAVASRSSTQGCAIVLMLFATRYLGPADFGVFALASMLVTLARTLLYAGPYEFLLKTDDEARWTSPALATNIFMALLGVLILSGLTPLWALMFGALAMMPLLPILAGSLPFSAVAAWQEARIIRSGHVTHYYLTLSIAQIVSLLIAIALLHAGWGIYALGAQLYAAPCIQLLIYSFSRNPAGLTYPVLSDIKTIFGWSSHRYGSTFLNFGSQYGGDLLLGLFLGPAATGIYRAANRIVSGIADIFAQPTRTLATIALSKMRSRGDPLDSRWLQMWGASGVFALPCLIGLAIFADIATPIALGEEWVAASTAVAILCLARALTLSNQVVNPAQVAYDNGGVLLRNQALLTLLQIALTAITAPFGVSAVAAGTALQSSVASVIHIRSVIRISERPLPWLAPLKLVGLVTLAVAMIAVLTRLLLFEVPFEGWKALLIGILACAVTWFALITRSRRQVLRYMHVLTNS